MVRLPALLIVWSLTAAASPSSNLLAVERSAREKVVGVFEHHGRRAPEIDPALSAAARTLASRALRQGSAKGAGDLLVVAEAISGAGAFDPQPKVVAMIFAPKADARRALAQSNDFLADDPSSHVGIGAAEDGQALALIMLFVRRTASLEPFPHKLAHKAAQPASETLCGSLPSPYERSELFVTLPQGEVEKRPAELGPDNRFCTPLSFAGAGRYTVELLARGPQGPEVAALFFVDVGRVKATGGARPRLGEEPRSEPQSLFEARERLRDRINKLRRGHGVGALAADEALDAVAQRFSERMASEHFFAHLSPDGRDLKARLGEAGYRYRTAGENLGAASGPLAAHFGIEHSPGHRKNLLEPSHGRIGIGAAIEELGGGRRQVVITEVLASVYEPSQDPLGDAYRAIAATRSAANLPPVQRSAELERIAQEEAESALKEGEPRVRKGRTGPHKRAFASMVGAESATIDVYIAESPTAVTDSQNLLKPDVSRVGVGLVRGTTVRYGRDKLWIYVLYVAIQEAPKPIRSRPRPQPRSR